MKKILLISFLFAATFAKGQQGTIPSAAHIVLIGGGLNSDSATVLRVQITDTAAALRTLIDAQQPTEIYNIQALTSSVADNTEYFFGQLPKTIQTNANVSKVYFRKSGIITGCNLYTYAGTAGTNESWTISLRLNNTTDYTIATVALNAAERVFKNSSMSITVSAGDYIEVHSQPVTWATNPASVIFGGYIEFHPN